VIKCCHDICTIDIDNAQEPGSDADGASTNEENFAVQLLPTITLFTISVIRLCDCVR